MYQNEGLYDNILLCLTVLVKAFLAILNLILLYYQILK